MVSLTVGAKNGCLSKLSVNEKRRGHVLPIDVHQYVQRYFPVHLFALHRRIVATVLMMLLAVASGCSEQLEKSRATKVLTVFGNVDIREVQLAFQDAGRILALGVDEGAIIHQGQVVAELDPVRYQLEVRRFAGEVAAQAQVLERLRQGSRPQEVAIARAGVIAARANLKDAEILLSRKQSLLLTNRISQQEVDSAQARVQTLLAALKSAEEGLSLAIEGPRKEDIAAAEATLTALQAAKELAEKRLGDTKLMAPSDGIIRNRILEPGAMVSAGTPVLTLALTNPLWVRAYISEPDLGKIQEGMRAELRTDSHPNKVYKGWIGFISSTAEFTPKTVESTELRTKLVYRARIIACDPQQELRLGMPVTVAISITHNQTKSKDYAQCD
jgi:HlyD family secretion protein